MALICQSPNNKDGPEREAGPLIRKAEGAMLQVSFTDGNRLMWARDGAVYIDRTLRTLTGGNLNQTGAS